MNRGLRLEFAMHTYSSVTYRVLDFLFSPLRYELLQICIYVSSFGGTTDFFYMELYIGRNDRKISRKYKFILESLYCTMLKLLA